MSGRRFKKLRKEFGNKNPRKPQYDIRGHVVENNEWREFKKKMLTK